MLKQFSCRRVPRKGIPSLRYHSSTCHRDRQQVFLTMKLFLPTNFLIHHPQQSKASQSASSATYNPWTPPSVHAPSVQTKPSPVKSSLPSAPQRNRPRPWTMKKGFLRLLVMYVTTSSVYLDPSWHVNLSSTVLCTSLRFSVWSESPCLLHHYVEASPRYPRGGSTHCRWA